MSLEIRLNIDTLRELGWASIANTYATGAIGTTFSKPVRILEISNLTDKYLKFSLNGLDDHMVLPGQSGKIIDITANKSTTDGFYLAEGQRIYVRYFDGAPTVGSAYVSVYYASEE